MKSTIGLILFTISLTMVQTVYADDSDVTVEKLKKNNSVARNNNQKVGVGTRGPGGMFKSMTGSSNDQETSDQQRKEELEELLAQQKKELEQLKKQNQTSK